MLLFLGFNTSAHYALPLSEKTKKKHIYSFNEGFLNLNCKNLYFHILYYEIQVSNKQTTKISKMF